MTWQAILQYGVFLALITALAKPLGAYVARVFQREATFFDPLFAPIERLLYRISRVNPQQEMDWKQYTSCFVLFGLVGTLVLYGILRPQRFLPWFYGAYMTAPMTPDLAIGQTFTGLSGNCAFYNPSTAVAMRIGRYGLAIPALCLAGLLASQIRRSTTAGAARTDTFTFGIVLTSTALIVMGLSFFPALTLGPVLEHLLRFS